jgi:ubiquinone/menaquinone biosynthesis C-methylase UbiE
MASTREMYANETHFAMMSFVHETLYGLFRDPYRVLNAAGLQSGQQVLEVGCGPGFFTVPAAEIVGKEGSVRAIDVNPLAVERVRGKIQQAGVTNAEVALADAAHTGLPDGSFDLVFVFGLARPIGDLEAIWAELHRVLKPGGLLSIEGRLCPPDEFFRPVRRRGRLSLFERA